MRTLKNREEIVEKLAEMLKKFDMQLNEYYICTTTRKNRPLNWTPLSM